MTSINTHKFTIQCADPDCKGENYYNERFCSRCGKPLGKIKWRFPKMGAVEPDWNDVSEANLLPVEEDTGEVFIFFQNSGLTPVGLKLMKEVRWPSWLDLKDELDPLFLGPGEEGEFRIRLHKGDGESDEQTKENRVAILRFRTSLGDDGESVDQERAAGDVEIQISKVKKPRLSPEGCVYNFLPIEIWQKEAPNHVPAPEGMMIHSVQFINETTGPISLFKFDVINIDIEAPKGFEKLDLQAVLRTPPVPDEGEIKVATGQRHELHWQFFPGDLSISDRELRWFSGTLRHQYRLENGEEHFLESRLEGVLGRGPGLLFSNPALKSDEPKRKGEISIERFREGELQPLLQLTNPGSLPVTIRDVLLKRKVKDGGEDFEEEVMARGDKVENVRDWLMLKGVQNDMCIEPGDSVTLECTLRPLQRPKDEYDQNVQARTLVILHSGYGGSAEGRVEVEVKADIGRLSDAKGLYLGIDFGTTQSTVALAGRSARVDHTLALKLTQDPQDPHPFQFPTRVFYNKSHNNKEGSEHGGSHARFLHGHQAINHQQTDPINFIDHLKSGVYRLPVDPYKGNTEHHIQTLKDGFQKLPLSEIFEAYIQALVERAESTLRIGLDADMRDKMGVQNKHGAFKVSNVVFSHPVKLPDLTHAHKVLRNAAGHLGYSVGRDFDEARCVEEPTAAVIAFMHHCLTQKHPIDFKARKTTSEKILCFDMGGGTTDVAAVEISNVSALMSGGEGDTVFDLKGVAGSNFGGNDLDASIAGIMLKRLIEANQSSTSKTRLTDEQCTEFLKIHNLGPNQYAKQYSATTDSEALMTYIRGSYLSLLKISERIKCALSEGETVSLYMDPVKGRTEPFNLKSQGKSDICVTLTRDELGEAVGAQIKERADLLKSVVRMAGWKWKEVTIVLLVGQSTRAPMVQKMVRQVVEESLNAELGESSPVPLPPGAVLDEQDVSQHDMVAATEEPPYPTIVMASDMEEGLGGFGPKTCVAKGAALYGLFKARNKKNFKFDNSFLTSNKLNFSLKRLRYNMDKSVRHEDVPDLAKGQAFEGIAYELKNPENRIEFSVEDEEQPYLRFDFGDTTEASIVIKAENHRAFFAECGPQKKRIEGEILL